MAKTRRNKTKRRKSRKQRRRRGGEDLKQIDILYPDKSYLAPP